MLLVALAMREATYQLFAYRYRNLQQCWSCSQIWTWAPPVIVRWHTTERAALIWGGLLRSRVRTMLLLQSWSSKRQRFSIGETPYLVSAHLKTQRKIWSHPNYFACAIHLQLTAGLQTSGIDQQLGLQNRLSIPTLLQILEFIHKVPAISWVYVLITPLEGLAEICRTWKWSALGKCYYVP